MLKKSKRPKPNPKRSLAPMKSQRPRSREEGLQQLKLDMAARYKDGGMVRGCGGMVSGKKFSGTY